jgi:chorismate dehydratase
LKYTVGSVPYANAIPLVARFEQLGDESSVLLRYDVPSRLPALLATGEAEAILVSSVDALRVPGRQMAAGVCIGSDGPVKSVRLFSKVRPSEIKTLALDSSSMTSNRLAQIILRERFGVCPEIREYRPNLGEMLQSADACVLIGDVGMTSDGSGLEVLDLGEEWTDLTSLPFVWAGWIGNLLDGELVRLLNEAAQFYGAGKKASRNLERRPDLMRIATDRLNWNEESISDYFFDVMVYQMDDRMLQGLRAFQELLKRNGFADCKEFPEIIHP